jgi:trans-aconitate methyltransferase
VGDTDLRWWALTLAAVKFVMPDFVPNKHHSLPQIRFSEADMERTTRQDQSVDLVISNGAFCLDPDKDKAFKEEVYRDGKP